MAFMLAIFDLSVGYAKFIGAGRDALSESRFLAVKLE